MSLRAKLTLFISGLGIFVVVCTLLAVNQVLVGHFDRTAKEDLDTTRKTLAQSFAATLDRYLVQGQMIADVTVLKEALIRESPELAYTYADSAQDQTGASSVVIANRQGVVLADTKNVFARGDKAPYLDATHRGRAGFLMLAGSLFAVAVVPVRMDDQIIGYVMLGEPLTAAVLGKVSQLTRSDVTLVGTSRKRLVSTLADPLADDVAARYTSGPEPRAPDTLVLDGISHRVSAEPLVSIDGRALGSVVIVRSLADQGQARAHLQHLLFGLGGIFTFIAILGGVLIGHGVGRPLRALTEAADRVARGEGFTAGPAGAGNSVHEDLAGGPRIADEVKALSRSFKIMAAAVAFRQERLQKEMEVAQQIQKAILPRTFAIEGLELSAEMWPATEVGGDYYDVLRTDDGCWIGVGDVAGHGLNAGLTMLMIQSMIAALVRRNASARPSEIVNLLNETLFENVRDRLGKDDHATLTLLRYRRDGKVVFAGAHEEVAIYRKARNEVELIATPGTWVGVCPDVREATEDNSLHLQPGDVMVLYTDGLIQTRNAQGEMLGIDPVCRALVTVHEEPADRIRERLMQLVAEWTSEREDDVSVVVAKYR